MDCSLQAKFGYIDKIPQSSGSAAVYGSAVHEAIDSYHKGKTLDEAVEVFRNYMNSNEPDYWNRMTSFTSYMDQGPKMIADYIDQRKWSTTDVVASEFRFMVPFGEHQISGIVDILELSHDHSLMKIVDLKTGKRPIMDALHLNIQFTIYEWASHQKEFWCGHPDEPEKYAGFENGEELYEHYKSIERKAYWYDLKKQEEIYVGPRSMKDYARLYRVCEQVARAVEHEVFVPAINENTCVWCPYQDICPMYFEADE
jgi:RecB family exonuclease